MSQSTSGPLKVGFEQTEVPDSHREWTRLVLSVSPDLDESLRELAKRDGTTVAEVLSRSVAIYRFLSDQHRQGKSVGVAAEGQELEVEVTGF